MSLNPDPLRDYQVADFAYYLTQPKSMNLSDPGTGKTPSVCFNQYYRASELGMHSIWVSPLSLLKKNKRELVRFTLFEPNDVAIIHGTDEKIDALLKSDAKTFLMGPTRFKLLMQQGRVPDRCRAIDVDEFHMCFGGAESQRTTAFYEFSRRAEQMVHMTGTLVNGRLDTAYPAIHSIEPRYYPGGYRSFMMAHELTDLFTGKRIGWRNHEKLAAILQRHGIRRTFKDVYGEQEIVWELEYVDLLEEQEAFITELRETAVIELNEVMIEGKNPGVTLIRCRQIMEHFNHMNDPRDPDKSLGLPPIDLIPGKRPPKEDRLEIHFTDHKENNTPVIVFAAFIEQHNRIATLARKIGLRAEVINSTVSMAKRDRIDVAFQRGELDVVVASPPCAAVGYNWQFSGQRETDHVIFASYTYMDSDVTQGIMRAIRGKRSRPLRVTGMEYYDSIDQNVRGIFRTKSVHANKVDPTRLVLDWH